MLRLLRLTARNARLAHRAARLVAGLGRLDLDHVGAHVGEHLPAERPGHDLGELDHPHAVERASPGEPLQRRADAVADVVAGEPAGPSARRTACPRASGR